MRRSMIMTLSAVLLCACSAETKEPEPVTVAMVGDSIFCGTWAPNGENETIEACLQEFLPEDYTVYNFGVSGCTLQDEADQPYTAEPAYRESLASEADYYIIMLGTNDAKKYNWDPERYAADYRMFVKEYIDRSGTGHVYAVIPPRAFKDPVTNEYNFSIMPGVIDQLPQIITEAAEELGVQVIDLYTLTQDHPEWYWDGIHPNAEGNKAIAEEIYNTVFIRK